MRKHEHGVASAPRKQQCRLIVERARCNKTTRRGAPPSLLRLRDVSSGTRALIAYAKRNA